jgi:DNA mismatch repair protein MutS2
VTGATAGPRAGSARVIPSTIDVRGARVDEVIDLLDQTLDRAALAGAGRLTVIHGHGTGALRDAVRHLVGSHPLVKDWRPGERGEGGDGATIISL